jgi:uncharacterized protein (TIGR02147 family)
LVANLLEEKTKKNPLFSMRAFARLVDISPAILSRILSGKRKLTFNLAVRIADALALGPADRELLFSFYLAKTSDKKNTDEVKKEKELSIDCFNAMREWYHYGITQLLYIENFREDHRWMAKMLAVSELQIRCMLAVTLLNFQENIS